MFGNEKQRNKRNRRLITGMETITVPKEEFAQMQRELSTLRETKLYKRLLQFQENIGRQKFTRADLGF